MKSKNYLIAFLILFFSSPVTAQVAVPTKTAFVLPFGCDLYKTFDKKIFVTHAHYYHPGKDTTTIYFTDGNGKVLKTVDVFKKDHEFEVVQKIEESKNALYCYKAYGKAGNVTFQVLILDKSGNQLGEYKVDNEADFVVWDNNRKAVSVIYPDEAIIKIYSTQGKPVTQKRFSKHFYKIHFSGPEEDDGGDSPYCNIASVSQNGRYILMRRSIDYPENEKFEEIVLFDTFGNIIYRKNSAVTTWYPSFVSDSKRKFIISRRTIDDDKTSKGELVGYDFNGEVLWQKDGNPPHLYIGDREDDQGFITLERPASDGINIEDSNSFLDVNTGKIITQ